MKALLKNLKIFIKVLIAPSLVAVFLAMLAVLSYTGLLSLKSALDDIYYIRFEAFQDASDLINRITTVNKDVYRLIGYANSGTDASKIDEMGRELSNALGESKALVKRALQKPLHAQERKLFTIVQGELEAYEEMVVKAGKMVNADANLAITMMTPIEKRFQQLNGKLKELLVYEQQLSREQHQVSTSNFNRTITAFLITVAVALALSLILSLAIARQITRPIRKAVDVIRDIAEGDLTREIHLEARDEIGDLERAVDTMRLKMKSAVGQSASTSRVLSESASRQASFLEETSSSLEEMTAMIRQSAGNATETNKLMNVTQGVIDGTNQTVTRLKNSMKEITEASEQTQKIVRTIDEIAFQTNLLALNAAVEAARAGEAGMGFAVVAEEVRNLALRAAEAAKNTSGMMDDIVSKVKQGEELVNTTYSAFQQVTESSAKVVNLMAESATAAQEQSQGIEQISRAMSEMNQVTQDNASCAEGLAASMAVFRTGDGGHNLITHADA